MQALHLRAEHAGIVPDILLMAKGMHKLMGVSGSESLAAAANVFMGQTEAPIIVKPYVPKMTQSELLAMMVGGDGFVGGMLYGILKDWEPEKWPQFGWATGALATTFLTDYAQPADEEQVWSVWGGNARVKR